MSSLYSIINQFFGINPILHSRLQQEGGWDNFHVNHISDLTRYLQRALRPLGYIAQAEQSLQIRRGLDVQRAPESDITIFDKQQRTFEHSTLSGGLAQALPDLLELNEEDIASYRAVGIYLKSGDNSGSDAVAWLELLSPTNKIGGRHATAYRDKRTALLQAGLVFVELDYLHQQPPTVRAPLYPQQSGSSPYRIVIIDPRPDWLRGEGRVYPIHVDEKLPRLDIPLNAGDSVTVDFDAPYQQTYETLFFGDDVNYATLPVRWESYNEEDQARILSRLIAVREKGQDLEKSPNEIETLSHTDALAKWQALGG